MSDKSTHRTESTPSIGYWREGDKGPPVLFIMGFGMPGLVWKPQVHALRQEYQCCYYDHLGVGESEPAPLFRTIGAMADDALRLMDELGWERAHIVGVSMGGMIAQEVALKRPERCLTVALVATHGGGILSRFPTLKGTRYFVQTMFSQGKSRINALEHLLYPPAFLAAENSDERHKGTAARLSKPAPPRTIVGHFTAVSRHRTEARLHQLGVPTLLVRPGEDILIRPSQTDRLARRIPNARVLRFDDAGHGVTFQKARELNAALRAHFQRVDSTDAASSNGKSLWQTPGT